MYCRIFDPLGFIQPFILKPKLLIQDLSRLKYSWDDEVPSHIQKEWLTGFSEISEMVNFKFPHCIVSDVNYSIAEMHAFADASKEAYMVACFGHLFHQIMKLQLAFYLENVKSSQLMVH